MKTKSALLLVVDDEELVRDMLAERLANEHTQVLTASSAREASQLIEQHRFEPIRKLEWRNPELEEFLREGSTGRAQADRIAAALASVDENERGQALLKPLKIPGLEAAEDSDWDDVRALERAAVEVMG